MDYKRIFIFTNDDNPMRGDADETQKVHMIAKVWMVSHSKWWHTNVCVRHS